MSKLALVGGTGGLGVEIAKGLVTATGFVEKIALVRSESEKSKNLADLGWKINVVDFGDAAALQAALHGVTVVVSAIGGLALEETEISIMNAAKAAGVALYVPSQFGVDFRRWNGKFPLMEAKNVVLKHAESLGLPTLLVFAGAFADATLYFMVDIPNQKAKVVDGGDTLYTFTRRSDIGYVLAEALADPKYSSGGYLSVHGETMSFKQALAVLEQVSGVAFAIENLTAAQAHQQEQGLLAKGDMGSFFAAFGIHLLAEPAFSNSTGFNVSVEADNHGHVMESFRSTIKSTLK
jgi:uncharacterized protein YbjT (DUF2867 family)